MDTDASKEDNMSPRRYILMTAWLEVLSNVKSARWTSSDSRNRFSLSYKSLRALPEDCSSASRRCRSAVEQDCFKGKSVGCPFRARDQLTERELSGGPRSSTRSPKIAAAACNVAASSSIVDRLRSLVTRLPPIASCICRPLCFPNEGIS